MNYKGAYSSGTSYSVGDVVVYSDGKVYILKNPAPTGTGCNDTLYWNPAPQPIYDIVTMFHNTLASVASSISALDTAVASIPTNISDEAITLTSGDNDYLITVDASGETPELAVTLIEEEAAT